jgi:hypothetical protein
MQELWFENTEERQLFGDHPLSKQEYFQKFRWWLKREYRHQKRSALVQLQQHSEIKNEQ